MMARYFNTIPSNKKHPMYLALVTEPIDLQTIERNINTGSYATVTLRSCSAVTCRGAGGAPDTRGT